MSQIGVQLVDEGQYFCKPSEQIVTDYEDASSDSDWSNDSIWLQTWAEVPISTNPYVTPLDLKANSDSDTPQCVPLQPSEEELETPVFSTVLQPLKSLSLLESPSDIEKPAIADVSEGVVQKKNEDILSIKKERESSGFFFTNVTTPKPFLPLTSIKSDTTWSDSDESSRAILVWKNVERNQKSQSSEKVKKDEFIEYIKHSESPNSETQSKDKDCKIEILQQVERQESVLSSFQEKACSETNMSELQVFHTRPQLLCGYDKISRPDPPVPKVNCKSGNLSTYIERQDSLLKGLVADGGTRDFAKWFDRLDPGLHCDQDFHTETGIFKKDFWHNTFARSKSFDKYLGLTPED